MPLDFTWRHSVVHNPPRSATDGLPRYTQRPNQEQVEIVADRDGETVSLSYSVVIEVLDNERVRMRAQTPSPARYDNWRPPTFLEMDAIMQDLRDRHGGLSVVDLRETFGDVVVHALRETYELLDRQHMMLGSNGGPLDWSNPTPSVYRSYGDPKPTAWLSPELLRERSDNIANRASGYNRGVTVSGEAIRYESNKSVADQFRSAKLTHEEHLAMREVAERFIARHPNTPYTITSSPGLDGERLWWVARAQDDSTKVVETEPKKRPKR